MRNSIASVTVNVLDYDEAIEFYTKALLFTVLEDTDLTPTKRWVRVAPPNSTGASLLLAKAANDLQRSRVGDQTGGRVVLFLYTDNFAEYFDHLSANGVKFVEAPREEAYGKVVVFEDLYGNRWDLIEPRG